MVMTKRSSDSRVNSGKRLPAWYNSVLKTNDCYPMYEHLGRRGFPTVKKLRRGILLGCIADALWLAANQGSYAGQHWDGDTYKADNQQGEIWAVAFKPEGAVAVFYSSESERNPFPPGSPPYDQSHYFRAMPDKLQKAKEAALSWMNNLEWVMGGPNAVVTAVMWADGEKFTANEPWKSVFYNSLWACHRQLLPLNVALIEWRDQFSLHDEYVAVLRSLYQRRIASTEAIIPVKTREREVFIRHRDTSGLLAAQAALANVGIDLMIDKLEK
jgi:hypothetical protein